MTKQPHIPAIIGLSELEQTEKSKADHVSKKYYFSFRISFYSQ